ncbi:expressed unknown protein [Seminavis robusta]|uniref:Uncharacterized protein n=1 Tax=Seminavis robusta TaxID=568900 RepID=A0A9N8HYW5_9STRA|nr:expressed unknown protein [Seminavis robusta]|eukprot:Sro2102_g314621.1  (202) ;mRNA; f:10391-10996
MMFTLMIQVVVFGLVVVSNGVVSSQHDVCTSGPLRPLIPFHHGETSSTGTVNASGSYSPEYEPYHAFSSDSVFWISKVYQDLAWISYTFRNGQDRTVRGYRFLFCNGDSLKTRAPKRFELQTLKVKLPEDASSSSLNIFLHADSWRTVDSRCCETLWHGCEERTYYLGTPANGTHFRFLFHEDNDARAPIVVVSLRNIQLL